MNNIYSKVFITNLPSFYKLNLYNAIAENERIFVVFTGDTAGERNRDFFKGDMRFEYFAYKQSGLFYRIMITLKLLLSLKWQECVIGGWDSVPMWMFALLSASKKNSVVVESSYFESQTKGLKGLIKKIFIRNIRKKAYVSGAGQRRLIEDLRFKGEIVETKGVGVFNYVEQPQYEPRTQVRNFLYVGRLTAVKNLPFLINAFKNRLDLTLNIVGFGELEEYLKSIAGDNVNFIGAVDNKKLPQVYQENDVFVLPSKSEVWGLVVEEALNNGAPVLVSDRVGCGPEIVNESNGLVFKFDSEEDLLSKIDRISQIDYYNELRKNISKLDFAEIERRQIECYLK